MIKEENDSKISSYRESESATDPEKYKEKTEQKFFEPVEESILPASVSDQPARMDVLGFEPYVHAIADFLRHPMTKPPLTLSVEGQWGAGKSSFMSQLEEILKNKNELTVNFNAWRHDKEEALWAAFALEFIHQISRKRSFLRRWLGHLKLLYYRFSWKNGWLDILRALTLWILIISVIATALLLLYLKGFEWVNFRLTESIGQNNNELSLAVANYLIGFGSIAGAIGIVISLWIKLKNVVGNPLDIDLNKYIQSPDYENRVSFIENFHKDFSKIVDAYAGNKKVYIFIDDLDRCEVPKASDLMQAINLMISSDPRLIFIIGMDREKIAASFAVKNKEVLPYLSSNRLYEGSSKNSTETSRGIEYGYEFIEKFIQLPFLVPQPAKPELQHFLSNISTKDNKIEEKPGKISENISKLIHKLYRSDYSNEAQPQHYQQKLSDEQKIRRETIRIAVTEDSKTIHDIVLMVAPALDNNPRRLKQFINLFRLRTFIANETGLFDSLDNSFSDDFLTLQQLGKFVAISLRWPLLIVDLDRNPTLLAELQEMALDNKKLSGDSNTEIHMRSNEARYWSQQEKLMNLLVSDCSTDNDTQEIILKKKQECDLSKLNIDKLLQVSPRVIRQISTSKRETSDATQNKEKSNENIEKELNGLKHMYETATEKKTLAVGESWDIGDGWVLNAQSIDAKSTPRQAWLVLSKDGFKKDDKVVSAGETYIYMEENKEGKTDVPRLVIFVGAVFAGATSDFVQLILKEKNWEINEAFHERTSSPKATQTEYLK